MGATGGRVAAVAGSGNVTTTVISGSFDIGELGAGFELAPEQVSGRADRGRKCDDGTNRPGSGPSPPTYPGCGLLVGMSRLTLSAFLVVRVCNRPPLAGPLGLGRLGALAVGMWHLRLGRFCGSSVKPTRRSNSAGGPRNPVEPTTPRSASPTRPHAGPEPHSDDPLGHEECAHTGRVRQRLGFGHPAARLQRGEISHMSSLSPQAPAVLDQLLDAVVA